MPTQTNPNSLKNLRVNKKGECNFCQREFGLGNLKKHVKACLKNPINQKECPVCKKMFAPKWSKKETVTCSYSCSNKYRSRGITGHLILDENLSYRTLCFRYHGKKCLVCNEDKIVAVHHVNENHSDNRPENLVPLCPTHHHYMHSKYKKLIESIVIDYVKDFIKIRVSPSGNGAAFGTQYLPGVRVSPL